jgi:hypothetical protein
LPGSPEHAFFGQAKVMAAIVTGRASLPYEPGRKYQSFVDMSGGSVDDAVLAIGHDDNGRAVLDLIDRQATEPPFNPRMAVKKFAQCLRSYHLSSVTGDNYAGMTFKQDFEAERVAYHCCSRPKTELYEALEPALNAGEVELLDQPKLQEQLLTLVLRGTKVDHEPNGHDDWANAAAGVIWKIRNVRKWALPKIVAPVVHSNGHFWDEAPPANRSTTARFYEYAAAAASLPPGSGPKEW